MLQPEHESLIQRWHLAVDSQMCDRLVNGEATPNEVHLVLQLWRKINANNMLYSLGNRRHPKTAESQFKSRIAMPPRLPELLDQHGAIEYPLRLADITLLDNIVSDIVVAPPLHDDAKQDILQYGYITISHVWVDGKMDTKGPLCRNVLADLDAQYVWMDKICIDQTNEDEKVLEIPKLKDYYKAAPLCLLAAPSASNESITDMDNAINELWNFNDIIEKQTSSTSKLSYAMTTAYKDKMDALIGELSKNGVLHHQWFTRVWTLPEMSVTQDLIVSNGEKYAYMTPLIELIGKYGRAKSREMFVNEGIAGCFDTLRMTRGYARFTLSEAMESSVGRTCTMEQDKIHALIGMVPDIANLPVRYDVDMNETLSSSCKLAYDKGDVSWMLNTHPTNRGFPIHGTRFLCPFDNDKLWLNHKYVKIVDGSGITISGSIHAVESWTHIHENLPQHKSSRLSHDVKLWSNLLVHASSDIRDLVKLTGWLGTASSSTFGVILVVIFCMSRPPIGLSVVIPSCIKDGIVTVPIVDGNNKIHIGRSVVIGSGIVRHTKEVLVC